MIYAILAAAFAGMIGAHVGWIFVGRKLAALDVIEHIADAPHHCDAVCDTWGCDFRDRVNG